MPLVIVRLEPLPPYDAQGHPECWVVMTSRNEEFRRFAGHEKALAEAFVTEFNITAYETDRRLRDARPAPRKPSKSGGAG